MSGGPALTPALALDYVRELSADVRAAVVLDAAGELLAGPAELAEPARALLAAAGDAGELEAADGEGFVCAVRTEAHAAVAVCGRFAIPRVVREDLRAALAALGGAGAAESAGAVAPEARPPRDTGTTGGAAAEPRAGRPSDVDSAPDPALLHAAGALISAVQRASEG